MSEALGVTWEEARGSRVVVHAAPESFAATLAPIERRAGDRFLDALENLAGIAPPAGPLDVFLVEPIAGGSLPDVDGAPSPGARRAIVRVVCPEWSEPPLPLILTAYVLAETLGPRAAASPLLVLGLAGLAGAEAGLGPPVVELDAELRSALDAGAPLAASLAADDVSPDGAQLHLLACTSFFAFLRRRYGDEAFRQFVSAFDLERRDAAAVDVFRQPLGSLQEAWLRELGRPDAGADAWRTLVHYLAPLLRPYRWRVAEIFLYMLLGLTYTIGLPLASKYLLDVILPERATSKLVLFVLVLLAIDLANAGLTVRGSYVSGLVNLRILAKLQERMFSKLQHLSHNFFHGAKVGDLMTRLSSDIGVVQGAMTEVAQHGVASALSVVAASITIFVLEPVLGAFVLLAVPLILVVYRVLGSRLSSSSFRLQERVGETQTFLQESLSAHGVIKAFGGEERFVTAFAARLRSQVRSALRLVTLGGTFQSSVGLATSLPQLMIMGVGGYWVITGKITLGTLVALLGLLPSVFGPLTSLANIGQSIQKASGALARVRELLDEPVTVADAPDAAALSRLEREIRFEDVSFAYSPDRPVLDRVSLRIPAGSHVAFVGPSGSGKSTVVNLLLRFWDPDSGAITFDEHPIANATLASLRGQIGLVFQDTFVFDTTLRENIAIGRPDATDAQIAAAAEDAQLGEFVAGLPAGLDTVLGEGGGRMSGGQRQRLAIARALVRDPAVLVLDEATSSLDAQTEREVLETIRSVSRGRTTVTVTHRLAVVTDADRIFVMQHGRIVEEGTHGELLAAGGLYCRLYEQQTGGARPPADAGDLLRAVPLFAPLSERDRRELAARLRTEEYAAGDDVIRAGEPGDRLCIVRRGSLEVMSGTSRGRNTLTDGDFFGEIALLTGEPRSATVRALTDTELLSLPRADFQELLGMSSKVRRLVEETLERRRAAYSAAIIARDGPEGAPGA